jgi:RDD family
MALGVSVVSGDTLLLVLGLEFFYFFLLEARNGQTLGKRIARVRVVAVDGSPATVRMAAIRNALRIADAFPILYASGLISLMRTGRARRQRIGDIVAGTTVVIDPRGRQLRTPRRLLPLTTAAAVAASVLLLAAILSARGPAGVAGAGSPGSPPGVGVAGFRAVNSQPPALGEWLATGATTSAAGYGGDAAGQEVIRRWMIARTCTTANCPYVITRDINGGPPLTAQLVARDDGWHVRFPDRQYQCGIVNGHAVYWSQQSTWVIRFTTGGRQAEAHERNYSYTPACGYGTDTLDWTATHR